MLGQKEILDIEPEVSIKIDCFQNLLITLLKSNNINPCIFGSTWPWTFFRKNKSYTILYQYFVSNKALQKLSGYQLMESDIQGDLIETLSRVVKEIPIIINTDQYHVKHHYPDVYNKVHGLHSLLLLDYDIDKLAFWAIGVFPSFKGWINEEEIAQGVISISNNNQEQLKYYWLEALRDWKQPTREDIAKMFSSNLYSYEQYNDFESLEINDIYEIFIQMHKNGRDSFLDSFKSISNDRWIWEIERPGNILISYIESDTYSPINIIPEREEIILDIKDINKMFVLALRKIYKYQLIDDLNIFTDGMEMLKTVASKSAALKFRLQSICNSVNSIFG